MQSKPGSSNKWQGSRTHLSQVSESFQWGQSGEWPSRCKIEKEISYYLPTKKKSKEKWYPKTAVMKLSSKYSLLTQKNKSMNTIAPWAEFTCKTIQHFQTERLHSVPPHFGSVKVSLLVSIVCPTGGIHKIIGKFSLLSEWQEPNAAKSMMNTMIFFNYPFGIKNFCKH